MVICEPGHQEGPGKDLNLEGAVAYSYLLAEKVVLVSPLRLCSLLLLIDAPQLLAGKMINIFHNMAKWCTFGA